MTYPINIDAELEAELRETAQLTGLSLADIIRQSMAKGLPELRDMLVRRSGRITSVDPLPDATWKRIYGKADEFSKVTGKQLVAAQIQEEPE
jgi:hypothetical protein